MHHPHHEVARESSSSPIDYFDKHSKGWAAKPLVLEIARNAVDALLKRCVEDWNLSRPEAVMDFGCGAGVAALILHPHVGHLVGVDPAPGMIEVFNQRKHEAKAYNVTPVCCNLLEAEKGNPRAILLAADKSVPHEFDIIYSTMTLHHLPDTGKALAAMSSLLKPGGWLVIFDIHRTPYSHKFHSKEAMHHGGVAAPGGFYGEELVKILEHDCHLKHCGFAVPFSVEREVHEEDSSGGEAKTEKLPFGLLMVWGQK